MTTMTTSSHYNDLSDFLTKHNSKTIEQNGGNSSKFTHTRIPNKELNIYGGSFTIEKEELPTFYRLY